MLNRLQYSVKTTSMHWETKNLCDLLFFTICFIAVVEKETHSIYEVCLYATTKRPPCVCK